MARTGSGEKCFRVVVATLAVTWASAALGAPLQTILPGSAIPKWVEPLPQLGTIAVVPGDSGPVKIRMCEVKARILPAGTPLPPGEENETWAWAYIAGPCPDYRANPPPAPVESTLGPVIVAQRGVPTEITYVNALGTAATIRASRSAACGQLPSCSSYWASLALAARAFFVFARAVGDSPTSSTSRA